jgi:assimilatory nitrate reductase catalytic subunit
MGSRLFSNTTSLPGGRRFENPAHRTDISRLLGISEERIPAAPSLAYDQIIEGAHSGRIRALWIIATNGAHSWIAKERFAAALRRLDFLVVQEMYANTETARFAHLILPAAGWGEKNGTFINSERRIGVVRKVARAPGKALSDFAIFRLIAEAWGCGGLFREWTSPEAVFQILKLLSRHQPCDFSGIRDYAHLEAAGGIQWPFPLEDTASAGADGEHSGSRRSGPAAASDWKAEGVGLAERRLFADGRFFTPDGRARFIFETPVPAPEPADPEFPLILLTGRGTSAQWHTGTRTSKSAILRQLHPARCYIEIHPRDAAALGLTANTPVRVSSRRGSLIAIAFIASVVQPGTVFIPMHYPEINRLTLPAFDPHSRQPAYKHCAVRLEPVSARSASVPSRCSS